MPIDAPDSTERAVYVQKIDPDKKDEYLKAHEDVPEAVPEVMREGGATAFELYVRDDIAVCIIEAEDIDEYVETTTGHPDNQEWERYVAQFKAEGVDVDSDDEQIPFMDCIWTLESGSE